MEDNKQTTTVHETKTTNGNTAVEHQTVASSTRESGLVIFQRVIWFLAGVIIVLLALRILLLLLAANQGTVFVDFIYSLSAIFAAPFYGIFNYTPQYGQFVFEISSVVAILVYTLAAWGITRLATLTRPSQEI